jgi:hypothetical protein
VASESSSLVQFRFPLGVGVLGGVSFVACGFLVPRESLFLFFFRINIRSLEHWLRNPTDASLVCSSIVTVLVIKFHVAITNWKRRVCGFSLYFLVLCVYCTFVINEARQKMGGGCSAHLHAAAAAEQSIMGAATTAPVDPLKQVQSLHAKFASYKDTVSIESFLKAAYRKANREEALVNIMTNDFARQHFERFLEREYFAGNKAAYEVILVS